MTIETIALDDVEELMSAGDLVDAKSIIGLFAARSALGWLTRAPGVIPRSIPGVSVPAQAAAPLAGSGQ